LNDELLGQITQQYLHEFSGLLKANTHTPGIGRQIVTLNYGISANFRKNKLLGLNMCQVEIKIDDLLDGAIETLLQEHLEEMHKYSPPDSIHAHDSDSLKNTSITFWSAWIDNELAACGALKEINSRHAEIKSMKTSRLHLRKGIGKNILSHILTEAKSRKYSTVSLETGTNEAFLPARKLYEQFGFQECGPFADYSLDVYSTYYRKELS
jgi:putative acetyltransferase